MGLFRTASKVAVARRFTARCNAGRRTAGHRTIRPANRLPRPRPPPPPLPAATGRPPRAGPAPCAGSSPAEDVMARRIAQLTQLGELRTAGVLTDAEFEAQKAVILAG